jgi:hypothetical protein
MLVVFIERENETREAYKGVKKVDYRVEIHVFMRSTEPDSLKAMDAFDACIESIKVRIRSDVTFGGALWLVAVQDIDGEYGEPMLNGETTEIWGRLSFMVSEWLTST